jgi:hypothetical protein
MSIMPGRVSSSLASRFALFESSSTQQHAEQQSTTTQTSSSSPSGSPRRRATPSSTIRPSGSPLSPRRLPNKGGSLTPQGQRRRSSITSLINASTPAGVAAAQKEIERYQHNAEEKAQSSLNAKRSDEAAERAAAAAVNNGHHQNARTLSYAELVDNRANLPDWVDQTQLEVSPPPRVRVRVC